MNMAGRTWAQIVDSERERTRARFSVSAGAGRAIVGVDAISPLEALNKVGAPGVGAFAARVIDLHDGARYYYYASEDLSEWEPA